MKNKYVITTILALGIPMVVFYFLFGDQREVKGREGEDAFGSQMLREVREIEFLPKRIEKYKENRVFSLKNGEQLKGKILSVYGGLARVDVSEGGDRNVRELALDSLDKDTNHFCLLWKHYELKYLPSLPYRNWELKLGEDSFQSYLGRLKAISEDGIVIELLDGKWVYERRVCLDLPCIYYVEKYSYDEEFFPMITKGNLAKKVKDRGFKAFSWKKRFGFKSPPKVVQYFAPDLARLSRGEKVPLIVFLHGAGEKGTDNVKQFFWDGPFLFTTSENQAIRPCFMLAPQHHRKDLWCSNSLKSPAHGCLEDMKNMVLEMLHLYPQIDPNRIYITGLSSGGWGALEAVARWPEIFAAGVSTAESIPENFFDRSNARPMWMFYNLEPGSPGVSRDAHIIQKRLAKFGVEVKITEYTKKNHNAWEAAYKTSGLHEWMFSQNKDKDK